MFTFIGTVIVSMEEHMLYMIWRPVLRDHFQPGYLIVTESKYPEHCLSFVEREAGGYWLLLYHVEDSMFENALPSIVTDATHRGEMLNRYDGEEWYANWRL